ncbi:Ppx/GppA phosphatase family protein [Billgrantia montanilacus]|uniref:Ppx/GppA family phosphatase n=1 Tax=Billgrantia montanilacus TaxID=2282305 RepID=A0A368U2G0_9GAMM|nr:Ppx/GppA phosphatase family protein [Halomonas montanilacus]RCV91235.1 Ppx/GppA family phosphatase [Halomonas montanilacus]
MRVQTQWKNKPNLELNQPHRLAAIDLGSNSFHLLVANYQEDKLQVVAKVSEKVQLAAGLGCDNTLSEESIQRALSCLAQFAPFVEGIPPEQMRIVGTNTVRSADNSQTLIQQGESLLGHNIEVLSGREEARLIYLGAAHALADVHGKRLIVDIGGGSTEFIVGEDFKPLALESLEMGCVTYTKRFFSDGRIDEKRFRQAEISALSELENIRQQYLYLGWSDPVGTSGTIRTVAAVLAATEGSPSGMIYRDSLYALRKKIIKYKRVDKVAMEGLKADRASVFTGGLAILCAIFEAFDLTHLSCSDGALREGVLYDLVGRNTAEDSRLLTLEILCRRYSIDMRQADNVAASAMVAFDQVRDAWQLTEEHRHYLTWAARLHELGLAVSHSQFQRHGAYLIEYSDLSGFSHTEQQGLAFLVRAHRRKYPLKEFKLLPSSVMQCYARLARLLRLAVVFNHSRPNLPVTDFRLFVEGETLQLQLSKNLVGNVLLLNDLIQERDYQQSAGFGLDIGQHSPATVAEPHSGDGN